MANTRSIARSSVVELEKGGSRKTVINALPPLQGLAAELFESKCYFYFLMPPGQEGHFANFFPSNFVL